MLTFLGGNPNTLSVFSNNAVNVTWASDFAMGNTGGPVGLGAVLLGIAANAAVANQNADIAAQVAAMEAGFRAARQSARDQVSASMQAYQRKLSGHGNVGDADYVEGAIMQSATMRSLTPLANLYSEVQTALPVVLGAAPKPPSITSMYRDMLWSYASTQGWTTLITGSQWHLHHFGNYYHISSSAGILDATDWPWYLDVTDLIDELNSIYGSP